MKGLELAYAYFKEYGEPMLWSCFSRHADKIACGLVGEGSECFGFDDELSQDHDFGAGFCLWLSDDVEQQIGTELARRYDNLPAQFLGFEKRSCKVDGFNRVGVIRTSDFYYRYIGAKQLPQTLAQWRKIPISFLATATNGQVFMDYSGEFTQAREHLLHFYPEDLRLKKLAAHLAIMAQAGQYNYPRAIKRKDSVFAALACSRFVEAGLAAIYNLNKRYMPFYKWAYRGALDFGCLTEATTLLPMVVSQPNLAAQRIEEVCVLVNRELVRQGLVTQDHDFLLDGAKEVVLNIQDKDLKRESIFND